MPDLLCKREKNTSHAEFLFFPMSFVNIIQFLPTYYFCSLKIKNKITSTNVCQNWEHFNK